MLAPLDNAGLAAAAGIVLLALAWSLRAQAGALRAPGRRRPPRGGGAVGAWTARNAVALGRLIPLKSNLWFELHLANVDSADGLPRMETVLRKLPFFDVGEFERYATLGEVALRRFVPRARRGRPARRARCISRATSCAGAMDAAVFCRREGGGAFTRKAFLPRATRSRLVASGELISSGQSGGGLWTRIDADPAAEQREVPPAGARRGGRGLAGLGRQAPRL